MASLSAKRVQGLIKNGAPGWHSDGAGLYLRIPKKGKPYWMYRFTLNRKRKELTLASYDDASLADARILAAEAKKSVRAGTNPIAERKRIRQAKIQTVDELFDDWLPQLQARLKHPNIPERIYKKEIAPYVGQQTLTKVTPLDIRGIIEKVANSGRPSIANDTLMYAKQLFNHGIKLGLLENNPAAAFTLSDAGGVEKSRTRALSLEEISQVFETYREHATSFTRENYLACALLLTLGVRKNELLAAKWDEFDLQEGLWLKPDGATKTGAGFRIPLPSQAAEWLEELKVRSCGSPFVFPNRRASKREHVGPDTLNAAIYKMFGRSNRKGQPKSPNLMGDIEHFTVHDLRRTFRSLLAANRVPPHVAERCLNHKLKGVEGVYDRYDYFEERAKALQGLSDMLEPIINNLQNTVPFRTTQRVKGNKQWR